MKNSLWITLITCLFLSCGSDDDELIPEVNVNDQLINALSDEVFVIRSSEPTINFSELDVLDQLSNARFIGMGEASHGTKEFFEMKHKMLRYFVENHGYRGLIMEADFGESVKANEYVTT